MKKPNSQFVAVPGHSRSAGQCLQQVFDPVQADEVVMAIAASRDDPRPAVAAATVFDELEMLFEGIEAKQRGS